MHAHTQTHEGTHDGIPTHFKRYGGGPSLRRKVIVTASPRPMRLLEVYPIILKLQSSRQPGAGPTKSNVSGASGMSGTSLSISRTASLADLRDKAAMMLGTFVHHHIYA